jgi:hypothetical protein
LSVPTPVGALIDDYVARGVFRAVAVPSATAGCENFRIVWFRNQAMDLAVDARRGRARLRDLLPPIAPRSKLDRELRAWLRSREAPDLPAHRRLDPAQFRTALRHAAGRMELVIASQGGDSALAVRKLLHLVNELYLDFLAAPQRYDWIVETFDLDPDHPQWP